MLYQEYFWQYAKETDYYEQILAMRDAYGDDLKARDQKQYENLVQMAIEDSNDPNNYCNTVVKFENQKAKGLVRINSLKLISKLIGLKGNNSDGSDK